jgi:hypothetical protein
MDQNCALLVAGIVFGLIAVIHIFRLTYQFDVIIAGKKIPLWANVIGLIIAVALCAWMLMART